MDHLPSETHDPHERLWTILGIATCYMCLSSFLHDRGWNLSLPLDLFKEFKQGVISPSIIVCWPMVVLTNWIAIRITGKREKNLFWSRMPIAFGMFPSTRSFDSKLYYLTFLILFHVFPVIHVLHFAWQFFVANPPKPMFSFAFADFLDGKRYIYEGASYYRGWEFALFFLLGGAALGTFVLLVLRLCSGIQRKP